MCCIEIFFAHPSVCQIIAGKGKVQMPGNNGERFWLLQGSSSKREHKSCSMRPERANSFPKVPFAESSSTAMRFTTSVYVSREKSLSYLHSACGGHMAETEHNDRTYPRVRRFLVSELLLKTRGHFFHARSVKKQEPRSNFAARFELRTRRNIYEQRKPSKMKPETRVCVCYTVVFQS